MVDRNKLIDGLRCCVIDNDPGQPDPCKRCPYNVPDRMHDLTYACVMQLKRDCLDYLVNQEYILLINVSEVVSNAKT